MCCGEGTSRGSCLATRSSEPGMLRQEQELVEMPEIRRACDIAIPGQ
jgi:hypothetical protein